ncbi:hypothetical protein [Rheinheimera salexigens]|uniref:Uncharacterized protein n=1 Tax=Rheinheimera salexigens TaxID=1628148 RepID=A0A1E7Q7V4_9GAMM|nr:hypothetical protein [Rheinheimera salexigens]OEY70217.1 hypothetical protein BI198_12070 [Rheinheimera salexigens]
MKKSVQAALLSALVYPGVGHFYVKKHVMGAVFVCAFSIPLYFFIKEIFAKAEQIVQQLKSVEIPLDIAAITQSLSSSTTGVAAQELNVQIYLLVIIWLIAIVDSYRLGRVIT